ncbi:MAG: HEPN domain-containing protein [Actinobacteria bacterium]|nr:HEPN domain-containing protein [Actinomycetota bacterium]
MPPETAPQRRLAYAASDPEIARTVGHSHVLRESLCFHAQQAAEKAIKAVLVFRGADPPRTHDLEILPAELPTEMTRDIDRLAVAALTAYAVAGRYPGTEEPIEEDERRRAVGIAGAVVDWAQRIVGPAPSG